MKPARTTCNGVHGAGRETRCACGSLLARLTPEGVELKCRRCKRLVIVRWSQPDDEHASGSTHSPP